MMFSRIDDRRYFKLKSIYLSLFVLIAVQSGIDAASDGDSLEDAT